MKQPQTLPEDLRESLLLGQTGRMSPKPHTHFVDGASARSQVAAKRVLIQPRSATSI